MIYKPFQNLEILEKGTIEFFYPLQKKTPSVKTKIQHYYMVLSPEKKKRFRKIIIECKRQSGTLLNSNRKWACVEKVCKQSEFNGESASGNLHPHPENPAALQEKFLGNGIYEIIRHGDHTHLVYTLVRQNFPENSRNQLGIEPEGNLIISVKKPERNGSRPNNFAKENQFPQNLMERFEDRRYIGIDPPEYLDQEGAELVMVASAGDLENELGITLSAGHHPEGNDLKTISVRQMENLSGFFNRVWQKVLSGIKS